MTLCIDTEALFTVEDTIDKRIAAATARAEKLPQAILSTAFKGELVPTEAELARAEGCSYETAEEMLDRIRSDGPARALARPARPDHPVHKSRQRAGV